MLDRYRDNFAALTPEEATHAASAIARRHPTFPSATTGTALYDACASVPLDQADVVLSMARDSSAIGVVCLEKIVGSPIQRPTQKQPRTPKPKTPRAPRPELRDDRVVRLIATDNPKRPGSASHARFALYRDGMSVQEFCRLGGTRADVKWDAERGYISVEDPS
jgi:hypothetical protein